MTDHRRSGQAFGREIIEKALRPHVGQGKAHSVEWLSEVTGIGLSTLKTYKAGTSDPGLGNFIAIARALPLSFANTVLAESGLRAIPRDATEVDHATIGLLAHEYGALLVEALADGNVDHIEESRLKRARQKLHDSTA